MSYVQTGSVAFPERPPPITFGADKPSVAGLTLGTAVALGAVALGFWYFLKLAERGYQKNPKLTTAARKRIPARKFAVPGTRKLPIHDPGHVRAAAARFNQTHFRSAKERGTAYRKIIRAGHNFGMNMQGFAEKYHRFA